MKKIKIPVNGWKYFSRGKRSTIYISKLKNKKIIMKIYKESRDLKNLAIKEAKNLIFLNKKSIGPKLIYYDDKKIVYYFVEGKRILDYMTSSNKASVKSAIIRSLNICFALDQLKINKKEMSHPLKHILVNKNKVNFIDFERAYTSKNPKNTSQFYDFLMSKKVRGILGKKNIHIKSDIGIIKKYKRNQNIKNYNNIMKNLFIEK